ncbi:hypothetical protein H4684_003534 [Desulfomicrobium macestii]|uniref:RsbT co-antagonist protein RsbRD N-terminal domain-containing protein n=1 Tax=Desulfomicrobium macestii TaxID=90731 RepID=A0ABR9H805_9BACT|nr:hypothetical protein [Desulfomicrobium macestii]MBE1426856.1 hypothetical protein [Desulfomicrobium macestii]
MQIPREETVKEVAVALVKGALQATPLVGGLLAEVMNLFVNPAEKRTERWLAEVLSTIEKLQKELRVVPEVLQNDERFISFLYQATQIALRNHRVEKIRALRNALEATAIGNMPEEDIAFQFLKFIDEFSLMHLRLLDFINKHAMQGRVTLEQVLSQFEIYLGASIERAHFRAVIKDLELRSLILAGDVQDLPEFATQQNAVFTDDFEPKPLCVTSLGQSFLEFIAEGR